ncbi:ABC transporter permease [Aminivibrio sp.]
MLVLRLAWRNIRAAGLRTWLNVAVLALTFLVMVGFEGLYSGMLAQSSRATIEDEIGGGQFWHEQYDPYDPLTLDESSAPVPPELEALIEDGKAAAVLILPASIYPSGRMQSALLRGIDPAQKVLAIPTDQLAGRTEDLPVLIGKKMARNKNLAVGDSLTIRWRDASGTFDARDGRVVAIMDTQVQTIDNGNLWVPLETLRKMAVLDNEATLAVLGAGVSPPKSPSGWIFRDQDWLLRDLTAVMETKSLASIVLYAILLFLAMLAIFDTQVLSIFRRRKEIGTLIALGMTRLQVIGLFTLEGMLHGVLAVALALMVGFPLLSFIAERGIHIPALVEGYGMAISDRLFPVYSLGLVFTMGIIVMITVTIVSWLPTRTIARLKPTEALQGKTS